MWRAPESNRPRPFAKAFRRDKKSKKILFSLVKHFFAGRLDLFLPSKAIQFLCPAWSPLGICTQLIPGHRPARKSLSTILRVHSSPSCASADLSSAIVLHIRGSGHKNKKEEATCSSCASIGLSRGFIIFTISCIRLPLKHQCFHLHPGN
jgi:hypothetical protein